MASGGIPRRTILPRSAAVCCVWAGAALAALVGGVLLFVFDPATSAVFPPCVFHALTGFHCPGCGTSRALHQLLHGNLPAALSLNPLTVLSLPLLASWCVWRWARRAKQRGRPGVDLPAVWIWTLLGVILLFSVLRNVPFPPFTRLAP